MFSRIYFNSHIKIDRKQKRQLFVNYLKRKLYYIKCV